jgi:hypothetical protein
MAGKGQAFGITAVGFVLAIVGFAIVVYEAWVTATIPLNDITFTGVGLAGVGIAAGAIGLDRGIETKG